ncbi:MAG: hypothetical protein ACI8TQ_001256 [Planctomycetota bacterium]|jgi:hypothetical protein
MTFRTNAMKSIAAGIFLSTTALTTSAQDPAAFNPINMVDFTYEHDSGTVVNDGDQRQTIIAFPVVFEGVSSITLNFSSVELSGSIAKGTNSELRITSMFDGAVQTMNATHVAQWENQSAYFNGDTLLVEVIASPNTGTNRVSIDSVEVGAAVNPQETQCGPVDDRQPSNDLRVSRLMPVGCTSWTINDCGKCMLSAGHCGSSGSSSVQFNVPFSTAGGSLVFPPPEDQYSLDGASLQRLNSTDDWQYFGVFPNSNTGLTPYEAYGAAFALANPPAVAGNNIRITGHGTDSTPNSTFNQKQQTHVGPFVSSGTNLNYQADTTGGSSGSPVIWEEQNVAIGIHTNGGCSTSGSGSNNGTPITAVSLQAALANPLGVCKIDSSVNSITSNKLATPFARPPVLTACGDLIEGSTTDIDMSLFVPTAAIGYNATAVLVVGFSQINMPLDGGTLVPAVDKFFSFPVDTSTQKKVQIPLSVTWGAGIPSGTEFYLQYWVAFSDGGSVTGSLASDTINLTWP